MKLSLLTLCLLSILGISLFFAPSAHAFAWGPLIETGAKVVEQNGHPHLVEKDPPKNGYKLTKGNCKNTVAYYNRKIKHLGKQNNRIFIVSIRRRDPYMLALIAPGLLQPFETFAHLEKRLHMRLHKKNTTYWVRERMYLTRCAKAHYVKCNVETTKGCQMLG